jgi:hypothetical protein
MDKNIIKETMLSRALQARKWAGARRDQGG